MGMIEDSENAEGSADSEEQEEGHHHRLYC